MDLFGDDIDSLLRTDDDDNELNDNIRENSDAEENGDDEKTDDKNENDERKVVEPKKRSVRNPQVRVYSITSILIAVRENHNIFFDSIIFSYD